MTLPRQAISRRALPPQALPRQSLWRRILLVALAALGLAVGGWALAAPDLFYRVFPGTAFRGWVALDGPYNEHLVRDVGALYLALAAASVAAIPTRGTAGGRIAGIAWVVFSVPHLAYHAAHLIGWAVGDAITEIIALGSTIVVGAALVLPSSRRREHGGRAAGEEQS